jgi:hypothetical protein
MSQRMTLVLAHLARSRVASSASRHRGYDRCPLGQGGISQLPAAEELGMSWLSAACSTTVPDPAHLKFLLGGDTASFVALPYNCLYSPNGRNQLYRWTCKKATSS